MTYSHDPIRKTKKGREVRSKRDLSEPETQVWDMQAIFLQKLNLDWIYFPILTQGNTSWVTPSPTKQY